MSWQKERKMTIQDTQNWKSDIEPYQQSDIRKSLWQLTNTIVPFFALWYVAYLSFSVSIWLTLAMTIPAAGFLVRVFIIFHDCSHHAFFKHRLANDGVGILLGFLALFPYHQWKHEHSVHHGTNGNLTRRGTGDIWTLTVDEYLSSPPLRRVFYRLYRNPLILFGLGPFYLLLFQNRFNRKNAGKKERWNTHMTTVVLFAAIGMLTWLVGWKQFLLIEGAILYFSGMAGIWLFYVQHQFEDSYFEEAENWDYVRAALQGSSFYKLPKVLQWITGNIGFHHIHHLGPRIPNYHLQRVYESKSYLQRVPTIGMLTSLRSLGFRVWDEERKKFRGFKGLAQQKSSVRL
jgi:omega-6 fatty acid desaturase (delta-12 desaturase)